MLFDFYTNFGHIKGNSRNLLENSMANEWSNHMGKHKKIPNFNFRRVIRFARNFSQFSLLAKSHHSKTNINKSSLSTSSKFFSQ